MNLKKGFTLIELLIVVTIIAILAGAAVPYVQDYVEQSRVGRAKADLDEIKRAIMLYETQYGAYTDTGISKLVGAFLVRNTPDPWSNPYVVSDASSTVYSIGPDGLPNTGDEVIAEYRPRMAVTKAYYNDSNGNETIDDNDALILSVCRPGNGEAITIAKFKNSSSVPEFTTGGTAVWLSSYTVKIPMTTVATTFKPGSTTVSIESGNGLKDCNDGEARPDTLMILYR